MNACGPKTPRAEVEQLAKELLDLDPPARLRMAAAMIERQRPDLAHMLAEGVVLELGAALSMTRLESHGRRRGP